jgi:hypothetical protein
VIAWAGYLLLGGFIARGYRHLSGSVLSAVQPADLWSLQGMHERIFFDSHWFTFGFPSLLAPFVGFYHSI